MKPTYYASGISKAVGPASLPGSVRLGAVSTVDTSVKDGSGGSVLRVRTGVSATGSARSATTPDMQMGRVPVAKKRLGPTKEDPRSLLDIALDVHMTNTGAYERGEQSYVADLRHLAKKLEEWEPGHANSLDFDMAVRELVEAALQEAKFYNPEYFA
jgi:hypothetical protein